MFHVNISLPLALHATAKKMNAAAYALSHATTFGQGAEQVLPVGGTVGNGVPTHLDALAGGVGPGVTPSSSRDHARTYNQGLQANGTITMQYAVNTSLVKEHFCGSEQLAFILRNQSSGSGKNARNFMIGLGMLNFKLKTREYRDRYGSDPFAKLLIEDLALVGVQRSKPAVWSGEFETEHYVTCQIGGQVQCANYWEAHSDSKSGSGNVAVGDTAWLMFRRHKFVDEVERSFPTVNTRSQKRVKGIVPVPVKEEDMASYYYQACPWAGPYKMPPPRALYRTPHSYGFIMHIGVITDVLGYTLNKRGNRKRAYEALHPETDDGAYISATNLLPRLQIQLGTR